MTDETDIIDEHGCDLETLLLCKLAGIVVRGGNGQQGTATPEEVADIRKWHARLLHRLTVDSVETKR